MAKITITHKGDFRKTNSFFARGITKKYVTILNSYGKEGVAALSAATPVDSGITASLWTYKIENTKIGISIVWSNSNIINGVPIAVILQYGHGTNHGGYVQGIDYINPALQPVFAKILNNIWKEVTS